MLEYCRKLSDRSGHRAIRCLFGGMAWVLLATGSATAGPGAASGAYSDATAVPGAQQSLPFSERRARWLGVLNRIDSKKFERVWQCMQFLGATEFLPAVNICSPCVSPAAIGNVRSAGLTAQERSCINRRTNAGRGGSGGQYGGNDEYQAAAHPQCSGVNPNGPRADNPMARAVREYQAAWNEWADSRRALQAAHHDLGEAQDRRIKPETHGRATTTKKPVTITTPP